MTLRIIKKNWDILHVGKRDTGIEIEIDVTRKIRELVNGGKTKWQLKGNNCLEKTI